MNKTTFTVLKCNSSKHIEIEIFKRLPLYNTSYNFFFGREGVIPFDGAHLSKIA